MKKFILRIFEFSIIALIIASAVSFFVYKFGQEYLPAMNFTDSYSYNEKVLFMNKKMSKPKVISIGSSMTLRNLHSETIVNEFKTNNYLNTASWGLKIDEAYHLLKLLDGIYDIDKVIMTNNLIDFQNGDKTIDYPFIKAYLSGDNPKLISSFLKNFNLRYYIKNFRYANYIRNNKNNHEYLNYDSHGMAALKREGFNIVPERWSDKSLKKPSNNSYAYLDSISEYCHSRNMKLYVFQSPHREGLVNDFTPEEKQHLERHVKRVKQIISDKHYFVNANKSSWNDSLFIDGIHLSKKGGRLFTQYCFDEIKIQQQSQ